MTRWRVASLILMPGTLFRTNETVVRETPDFSATSKLVTRFLTMRLIY
jgi:hypothetical protein